jgi:hypothetical protein
MPHLDIDAFEYAMGLFSVVIGLAVTDVATSFHALMRARARSGQRRGSRKRPQRERTTDGISRFSAEG